MNAARSLHVLVFPSCNEPGLEVIDALSGHPRVKLFGGSSFNINADPSRLLLGHRHFELPALGEPGFRAAIRRFCGKHEVDLVFPTVDAVVAEMGSWTDERFDVIAPSGKLAHFVLSKTRVYDAIRDRVPVPRAHDDGRGLPAFAKPDVGSGSRGARRLDDEGALARAREEGLLVQEYLPGAEYTVDCISDPDGVLVGTSVRRRDLVVGGVARASTCLSHPVLEGHVAAIAEVLPLAGPWFAQFREDRDGVARLMEVNARIGGSAGVTRLSGMNIPLMAVLSFSGVALVAPPRITGVSVVRRLDRRGDVDDFEWVIWDLDDTLTRADGSVDPETVGWLYRLDAAGKSQILLSKNPDPAGVVLATKIPNFFVEIIRAEDKERAVDELLQRHEFTAARAVMINDSNHERLAFARSHPELRWVSPDAIGLLRG